MVLILFSPKIKGQLSLVELISLLEGAIKAPVEGTEEAQTRCYCL